MSNGLRRPSLTLSVMQNATVAPELLAAWGRAEPNLAEDTNAAAAAAAAAAA
eukprot:CAMPEP_0115677034 /NCGR_PEP_ID=MMETSP0272-20121206/55006_1 /TAXON_ID=71861 /ORGANISM="Scrippsiella trochoidea, Strain CCMP3099" /LENGTH=51 /DNA_ID=CAMNT_0003116117 /DNA_START=157 /DNA_END=309 /DNA_ORIENTATION=-